MWWKSIREMRNTDAVVQDTLTEDSGIVTGHSPVKAEIGHDAPEPLVTMGLKTYDLMT